MSKSCNNTIQRHPRKLALALIAGGLAAGCSGHGDDPLTIDPTGYDGISETSFPLLTNHCTIANSTLSLSVRGGETLYLTLRATDNMVVAGATDSNNVQCAVPASFKIAITEDVAHTGTEKVFLDYINGPFALGTTVAQVVTPGITMTLGIGTPSAQPPVVSSVTIRGSAGVDKIYLGSTIVSTVVNNWVNVNGDTTPDIKMIGVSSIKVTTGVGADIISADGGNGTNASPLDTSVTFSAYGGPDADTLTGGAGTNTLDGGDGDDKFIQTLTLGSDTIVGGKGIDTVDYSVRTTSVNVATCGVCVQSDPCSCDANLATCQAAATTAFGLCNGPLVIAQTACKGSGDATAVPPNGGCAFQETACETTNDCPNAANPAACVAACVALQATCDGNCDTVYNTANATCLAAQTASNADCATAQGSCKMTCRSPLCSICSISGAANEHDAIDDQVEVVLGGKSDDTLSVFFSQCADGAGGLNKCSVKGQDGNDTLIGGPFNDLLDGGNGNDLIQPGEGNDTVTGGAGTDTVSYTERVFPVKVSLDATALWTTGQNGEGAWTADALHVQNGQPLYPVENDTINADVENLVGGASDDFLRGSSIANIIFGGAGNDTIEGGGGNDSLYGEAGADKLYGGAGDDYLVGGDGADTLVGGDGTDLIDATDSVGQAADTLINCDGANNSTSQTAGTSPATNDAVVKDSGDSASNCEF